MKLALMAAAALAALSGCVATSAQTSRAVQMQGSESGPAAQVHTLRVDNVAGSISVTAADGPNATIRYTRYGATLGAVQNTQVAIDRTTDGLSATTHYAKRSLFGGIGGAVDYTVEAPATASLHLSEVSGPIAVRNVAGDLDISQVSGAVTVYLGRVRGDRSIRVNSISGRTTLRLARDSDAVVDLKSVGGNINAFFPASTEKGFVGKSLHGRLGSGSASIEVNSVRGAIDVLPQ